MQNIKQEYYLELDEEFKKKYKEYIGVDPDDTSASLFTEKQQIERYARNIAFWKKESVDVTFDSDGKTLARSFLTSQSYTNVMSIMIKKFSKENQKKIMDRVKQLLDNKRINEIEKIRKRLEITHKVSLAYYRNAKNDISDTNFVDPTVWFFNQDKMRNLWEKFKNSSENMGIFGKMMINNTFGEYMQFMYNSYPPNFQNEIKRYVDEFGYADGAEIYYNLTN